MGNAEGCCGMRSPDQVRENNGSSDVSNEGRRRNFIVRTNVFIIRFFYNRRLRLRISDG